MKRASVPLLAAIVCVSRAVSFAQLKARRRSCCKYWLACIVVGLLMVSGPVHAAMPEAVPDGGAALPLVDAKVDVGVNAPIDGGIPEASLHQIPAVVAETVGAKVEERPPPPSGPAPAEAVVALETTVGGMVQARYQATIDGHGSVKDAGFSIARARIDVQTAIGSKMRLQSSLAVEGGHPELFTAYATYEPWRFTSFNFGQMRVPFSRSTLTPEERLVFPERSVATQEVAYLRDIGLTVRAHGLDDRLEGILGAFNGAGPNRTNDNVDPMLLARLAGTPLGKPWQPKEGDPSGSAAPGLTLGGTLTVDYIPTPAAYGYASGSAVPVQPIKATSEARSRGDNIRVIEAVGDAAFRFRGFALECEVYQRLEKWKQPPVQSNGAAIRPQKSFRGWFAQLSHFILRERLQVAGRASVARLSPLAISNQLRPESTCLVADGTYSPCAMPYADVRSELGALAAYRYQALRLTASYSRFRWSTDGSYKPPPATENRFTFQAEWVL